MLNLSSPASTPHRHRPRIGWRPRKSCAAIIRPALPISPWRRIWAAYTAAEHDLWRRLFQPPERCGASVTPPSAFLDGMQNLDMPADRIPDFEETSQRLRQLDRLGDRRCARPHSRYRLLPASRPPPFSGDGLDPRRTRDRLSGRTRCVPRFLRPCAVADPADLCRLPAGIRPQGRGSDGLGCHQDPGAALLVHGGIRPHPQEDGQIKAYGAGMLSSATETAFSVDLAETAALALRSRRASWGPISASTLSSKPISSCRPLRRTLRRDEPRFCAALPRSSWRRRPFRPAPSAPATASSTSRPPMSCAYCSAKAFSIT